MLKSNILNLRGIFFGAILFLIALSFVNPFIAIKAKEIVPDFTIDTLDGPFTLSEHLGKTLVLFFSFPG